MENNHTFKIVGPGKVENFEPVHEESKKEVPYVSFILLGLLITGCLLADVISDKNPAYLHLMNCSEAPNRQFLFGTDSLGRDLFSCIWHGGRVSIFIGMTATLLSTVIAIIYGAVSGIASDMVDTLMMRFTEVFLSVPSLLLIIFIQAVLGEPTVLSISVVIGITSWCSIAKIVRTEVRQIRKSEYVLASRCMGGNFFHILWNHLGPNFISSIMFMIIMNIRSAIVAESTLSFMGMGLPLDIISWGSLLSMSNKALMTKAWWVIVIPGFFLILLLLCLTNIGNWLRKNANQKESNL